MKKIYLASLILAVTLAGAPAAWAEAPLSGSPSARLMVAQAGGDSSEVSLDWGGVYRGILPQDRKTKIETTLTLNSSHTYTLSRKAAGKDGKTQTTKGSFSWLADGGSIMLSDLGGRPRRFAVGANRLQQLDDSGKPIKNSVLLKISEVAAPALVGTKWLLVEITGSDTAMSDELQRPHFTIDEDSGKVTGFAGCNSFAGGYVDRGEGKFELSKLASTMMACPQMEIESQFLAALERADNYRVLGATLYLQQGDKRLLELRVADPDSQDSH